MPVVMELATGDSLVIGESIIKLDRKAGSRARLVITSNEHIERIKAGEHASQRDNGSPAPFLRRPAPT